LNPSHSDALNWLFVALWDSGRQEEAQQIIERLLVVDPLSVPGRNNMAMQLAWRGKLDAAWALLDSLDSDNPVMSYDQRGDIFGHLLGELSEALKWWLRSHALAPEYSSNDGSDDRSLIYGYLNLLPEALRLPRDLHHWAYYGMTLWPELISDLSRQLDSDPSDPQKKLDLANALHLSGDIAQAQVLYEDLLAGRWGGTLGPATNPVVSTARAAYGRKSFGDTEGAETLVKWVKAYQEYRRREGVHQPFYYRIAAILLAMESKSAEAMRNIEAAIRAGLRDRSVFSEPAFEAFRDTPEFAELEARLHVILAREREKVLQLICFDNPVPDAWQPLRETCEGVEES
jgi:tetratricopeptide (TPR) repeat protein